MRINSVDKQLIFKVASFVQTNFNVFLSAYIRLIAPETEGGRRPTGVFRAAVINLAGLLTKMDLRRSHIPQ